MTVPVAPMERCSGCGRRLECVACGSTSDLERWFVTGQDEDGTPFVEGPIIECTRCLQEAEVERRRRGLRMVSTRPTAPHRKYEEAP